MRIKIFYILGAVFIAFGAFVALRPLFASGAAVTGSRGLDMGFAAFFLIRGVLNVRAANRLAARSSERPPGEPIPHPDR